jgi:uncharacterized protein YpbB
MLPREVMKSLFARIFFEQSFCPTAFFSIFNVMKSTYTTSNPAEFTERFINQTNQSVFLTGKAGTGKTTLLRKIIQSTHKNAVIVAPTGIAALNAGGVTIHSFFQLPFGAFIPEFMKPPETPTVKFETKETLSRHFTMNKQRRAMMQNLELLIIDEVSMLRADLLDAMDWTLRNVRRVSQPFGGVQVLYIGDLLQLPPVVKPDEWNVLRNHYSGMFFFNSKAIQEQPALYIELSTIFRQQDTDFIDVLNHLRDNRITESDITLLNRYVNPTFDALKTEGYITLTTHNAKADTMNAKALATLNGKSFHYSAEITGEFPPHMYPIDPEMELKVGAQVMFIKNDIALDKQFYNGKMGKIESLSKDEISVHFPEENTTITVDHYEWNNIRYAMDERTGEIKEEVLGTFVHYPLKLAWAITVHKSQGLTFDKAVLDVTDVFAPGQAYVALSRLRSLDGLVLLNPMRMNGLSSDQSVVSFAQHKADNSTLETHLTQATKKYLYDTIHSAFDWYGLVSAWHIHEATYRNAGSKTEKGKNKPWLAAQLQALNSANDAAKKFQHQIERIFTTQHIDLAFLHERTDAAYTYFFKILDGILLSNLKKMAELGRVRKTKTYAEELGELDELLTSTILRIKKVRLLTEALHAGKDITKEVVWNEEIRNYKSNKIAIVRQEAQNNRSLLDTDDDVADDFIKPVNRKKTGEKKEKKSTYEQTLELLHDGLDPEQVAKERSLSVKTILGHCAVLIKEDKLSIDEVLPQDRIAELDDLIGDYTGASLTPLKEQLGDEVSYEELRLWQASKIRD